MAQRAARTTTWVGLLRAVNVGGRNKAPMATVRSAVEAMGATAVRTYLQSGNVVFTAPGDEPAVTASLATALSGALGFEVGVTVRSAAELATVLASNPLATDGRDAAKLAVTFLAAAPAAGVVAPGVHDVAGEEYALVGRALFLYARDGFGRSKLTTLLSERRLGVAGTSRNWRTVGALVDLTAG